MADNRDLHAQALQVFDKLVAPISDAQWDDDTPCSEWKVRDLVNHVVSGNLMFGAVARGEQPPEAAPSGDPKAALAASIDAVGEAFAPDEVNDRMLELPFGTLPAQIAIGIHTIDVTVHSWDLAKATGQQADVPDDLVDACWSLAQMFPETPQMRAPGGPFGPKVDCGADASTFDRLVAHLGRTP